jgi:hypothetical protein
VAAALRGPKCKMRILNLSQNRISSTGCAAIMDALTFNRSVKILLYSGNESMNCGVMIGQMLKVRRWKNCFA